MERPLTLKFWGGGFFKRDSLGKLLYVGKECRIFYVDSDELFGGKGLRNVYNDSEVKEMVKVGAQHRLLSLYVTNPVEEVVIMGNSPRKKLTPKRGKKSDDGQAKTQAHTTWKDASTSAIDGPHSTCTKDTYPDFLQNITDPQIPTQSFEAPFEPPSISSDYFIRSEVPLQYDWEDPKPEDPLSWFEIINDTIDVAYEPEDESSESEKFDDYALDEFEADDLKHYTEEGFEEGEESYTTDEEYKSARARVKGTNRQLLQIAQQLQEQVASGRFVVGVPDKSVAEDPKKNQEGPISDYELSDEEIHTPLPIFQWKVGQRFATKEKFKRVSDKNRGGKVGVACQKGCPFKIYASWDSRRGTFLVKRVFNEHSCVRTMERNRQLKTTWLAEQFLELFKARAHLPAKEIIECIRVAYKVLLLVAIGRDGNDQMYHVAWCVVEGENNSSWGWFFGQIRDCLDLGEGDNLTIISDQHQSILSARAYVLPNAEHRHCARHAYNEADFNDAVEAMEKVNKSVSNAFRLYNPTLFCRAFMNPRTKTDVVTNNMAETFNGYIVQARTKHLLHMLEEIRASLM
ncbi:Elongation factor 4 [Bienertia sinuspersici]